MAVASPSGDLINDQIDKYSKENWGKYHFDVNQRSQTTEKLKNRHATESDMQNECNGIAFLPVISFNEAPFEIQFQLHKRFCNLKTDYESSL